MSFDRLFSPLVVAARQRLREQVAEPLHDLLTVKARVAWEGYLLKRLRSAGNKVADQQFQVFCTARAAFPHGAEGQNSRNAGLHREFIGDDPALRLSRIFENFPGLAQVCDVLVENWVSTVQEFLVRLNTDLGKLSSRFAGGPFVGPLDELHAGLSDPHRGGRCVVRITFPNSGSLIYKPRPLAPEAHFSTLLEELNTENIPHALRGARCWDRGEYGWMEDTASKPCEEPADLRAFYWRAGALLALVYLLRGVDMHQENLIAFGAYPVLIDLETLWHPQEHVGSEENLLADTILRTGFLPQRNPISGATYEWNAISHRSDSILQGAPHLPVVAGVSYPAPSFLPDILCGFRWIGEQVFAERRSEDKFLVCAQALARCRRRRILRATSWYQSVIERLTAPPSLRETRNPAAEGRNDDQTSPPMTEGEWRSLLQMDVPYVEQTAVHGKEGEEKVTLPVLSMKSFLKQEAVIINAFAPAADGSGP